MTSSKIRRARYWSHKARSRGRYAGRGSTSPMFPGIGSTITAAIWSRFASASNAASMASRSLNGTTRVSATHPGVTPADPGIPSVRAPEPAAASRVSAWP